MTDLERIKKDVVEMDSRANVCWYDTKVLTKAVRLILEELTADRKTENCSEKPNNCEECEHWNDTEDGCADRPQGAWIRDRYWSRGIGMGEDYGFFYKCSLCEYEVENGYTRCGFNFCPYCGADMREREGE